MMKNDLLITFASWEDRFRLGFDRDLENGGFQKALVFYFDGFAERTQKNRDAVKKVCEGKQIEYIAKCLDVNKSAENWRIVLKSVEGAIQDQQSVLVDISTMPREIIWYVLWQIEQSSIAGRYVYHSPDKYGNDWLSRNPQSPRLVYKLSGLALPSTKTALLVTVGFDLQRVKRLVDWYEPAKLLVGIQSESPFERNNTTMPDYRNTLEKEYKKECDCEMFELDAFAEDRGMGAIQEKVEQLDSSYNVIMSSLGPKLTAITLYRLQRENEKRGLVYTPSNEFSETYSSGIGRYFEGTL